MTSPSNPPIDAGEVFTRQGHLTMLALDRFECGELSTAAVDCIVTHLGECTACAERLALVHETPPLRPPASPRTSSGSRWASAVLATGLAVAATVALAVWLQPQQASRAPLNDGLHNASAYTTTAEPELAALQEDRIALRVMAGGRELREGNRVAPTETLRLEIEAAAPGFVALLVTHDGDEDALFDGSGTGEADGAYAWTPLTDVHELDERLTWTHTYSPEGSHASRSTSERLWVLWCAEAFSLRDLDRLMQGEGHDCVYETHEFSRSPASRR